MKFIEELTTQYSDEPLPIFEALTSAIEQVSPDNDLLEGVKDSAGLFSKNKGLAVKAVANAVSSFDKVKGTTLRHTIRLHAKSPYEKRMVKDIVDALTDKKGAYKVYRSSYKQGGKFWELRKKNSGTYKYKRGQG